MVSRRALAEARRDIQTARRAYEEEKPLEQPIVVIHHGAVKRAAPHFGGEILLPLAFAENADIADPLKPNTS